MAPHHTGTGVRRVVPGKGSGIRTSDGQARIKFERSCLQVAEVRISIISVRQFRSTVTIRTGVSFLIVRLMACASCVVIFRSVFCPFMAGSTLRIDIDRTARPGRRRLATVAAGVGAGAAVEAWRATTLVIEAGQYTDLRAAIIMVCATVAGVTVRAS